MGAKKNGRGGPREGSGRKPAFPGGTRGNRVVVMLTNEEARVLNTRTHHYTSAEVVDFELAVVVRTSA